MGKSAVKTPIPARPRGRAFPHYSLRVWAVPLWFIENRFPEAAQAELAVFLNLK